MWNHTGESEKMIVEIKSKTIKSFNPYLSYDYGLVFEREFFSFGVKGFGFDECIEF